MRSAHNGRQQWVSYYESQSCAAMCVYRIVAKRFLSLRDRPHLPRRNCQNKKKTSPGKRKRERKFFQCSPWVLPCLTGAQGCWKVKKHRPGVGHRATEASVLIRQRRRVWVWRGYSRKAKGVWLKEIEPCWCWPCNTCRRNGSCSWGTWTQTGSRVHQTRTMADGSRRKYTLCICMSSSAAVECSYATVNSCSKGSISDRTWTRHYCLEPKLTPCSLLPTILRTVCDKQEA